MVENVELVSINFLISKFEIKLVQKDMKFELHDSGDFLYMLT